MFLKNNIILVSGRMGSGKDAVSAMLKYLISYPHDSFDDYNAYRNADNDYNISTKIVQFAECLKQICASVLNIHRGMFESSLFKEGLVNYFVKGKQLTGRELLTHLGDKFREDDTNIFINYLLNSLNKNVVNIISDGRYENELDACNRVEALTIRINRPCKVCGRLHNHSKYCEIGLKEHKSERNLDDKSFHHIINNTGNLEDLYKKVQLIVNNS